MIQIGAGGNFEFTLPEDHLIAKPSFKDAIVLALEEADRTLEDTYGIRLSRHYRRLRNRIMAIRIHLQPELDIRSAPKSAGLKGKTYTFTVYDDGNEVGRSSGFFVPEFSGTNADAFRLWRMGVEDSVEMLASRYVDAILDGSQPDLASSKELIDVLSKSIRLMTTEFGYPKKKFAELLEWCRILRDRNKARGYQADREFAELVVIGQMTGALVTMPYGPVLRDL